MGSEDTSKKRLDQLDGLRALAVAGVIVQHSFGFLTWSPSSGGFESGAAGVRLFFVLSGFLITGILLRARQAALERGVSRWIVWRAFYVRRALRILPLAYLVLAVAWLAGSPSIREHPWMYALYTSNLHVGWHGFTDPSLDHFWSLAIEEQFYLFWPIVILATPRRWTATAMFATVALSMMARADILSHPGDIPAFVPAMVMTSSRLDALAMGGLLAWHRMKWPRWTGLTIGGLLIGGIAVRIVASLMPDSIIMLPLPETANVLLCGALVLWAAQGIGGALGRALGARPLVAIGTISYGIYVYHMVIAGLAPIVAARFGVSVPYPYQFGWPRFAWMVATTIPIAALSWRWFERPLNDLKARYPYVPTAIGLSGTPSLERQAPSETPSIASRAAGA
jgi:peptidoglycan/LPS O-acetylase OafA/YrhL